MVLIWNDIVIRLNWFIVFFYNEVLRYRIYNNIFVGNCRCKRKIVLEKFIYWSIGVLVYVYINAGIYDI